MSKQHTEPCGDCPFRRTCPPGKLGGSPPETYIGQIFGPFWLPCHCSHDSTKLEERLDHNNTQCAGAAIHRSNIGVADRMPELLLHLPENKEIVFATQAEFLAHHVELPLVEAEFLLKQVPPSLFFMVEDRIAKARAKEGKAFYGEKGLRK
jgi:hypothetical protein